MISTTKDLNTFISALLGGRLLPRPLLAEMLKPHATSDPTSDHGLGLFELHADANCSGTILINHNGSVQGYATLMYSTPDGSKSLTASLTYVDDVAAASSLQGVYTTAVQMLTKLGVLRRIGWLGRRGAAVQSTGFIIDVQWIDRRDPVYRYASCMAPSREADSFYAMEAEIANVNLQTQPSSRRHRPSIVDSTGGHRFPGGRGDRGSGQRRPRGRASRSQRG
ncbi:hypothetical protein Raf01_70920 [Rugosimonospora africana]|uniref:Uncharacterized protein n=2 Tax=Rugosimonospora africana TaxID=556532 RepID=A0A8J3R049_9ACTN|nr:hypothetical protein Raf01_70920 [Rugosimonospora africana]